VSVYFKGKNIYRQTGVAGNRTWSKQFSIFHCNLKLGFEVLFFSSILHFK
jgi:hypothetical protein